MILTFLTLFIYLWSFNIFINQLLLRSFKALIHYYYLLNLEHRIEVPNDKIKKIVNGLQIIGDFI